MDTYDSRSGAREQSSARRDADGE